MDAIAPRPVLLIVGTRAVTSWMAIDVFQRARGPKDLHWIDGATHVALYDKEEYATPAIAKLTEFFTANLAAALSTSPATAQTTRPTVLPPRTRSA
jgi:fermentation-respiration switch protein FrsA (DUF1100 family)